PMRAEVFEKRYPIVSSDKWSRIVFAGTRCCEVRDVEMGLAPGGRMRQEIYTDPFSIHDWDTEHRSRCFIHLVNSSTWHAITGQNPPTRPPTAKDYTRAGYPWFDYYDAEQKALNGSSTLTSLKSVLTMVHEKRQSPLPEN